MKKFLVLLLSLLMAGTCLGALAGCSSGEKELLVLLPHADHGWTGAVLNYAKEEAEKQNKGELDYKVVVKTATDASDQIKQIDDIIAASKKPVGIVILPHNNELTNAMGKLADANIPFVMFDRIIEDAKVQSKVIANVKGDNEGIGAATAKRFVEKGMMPGDAVYEMIGDLSSVPASRSKGFRDYLTGELASGGSKIADDKKWTAAQLSSITKSDSTDWSRAKGKTLFSTWIGTKNSSTMPKWIFTHDDEIGMGILEALESSDLTADQKTMFKTSVKSLGASSGLNEMYSVLKNNHKTITRPSEYDLFSVTYDPAMIINAIKAMIAHTAGTSVSKEQVVLVNVVDKDNVTEFKGFGDAVAKA